MRKCLIAAPTQDPPPINFQDEHIGSRKDWGAYVNLMTEVHRKEVAEVNNFIAQVQARLEQAVRRRKVVDWPYRPRRAERGRLADLREQQLP